MTSYFVAQRKREIAIRMVVGVDLTDVGSLACYLLARHQSRSHDSVA